MNEENDLNPTSEDKDELNSNPEIESQGKIVVAGGSVHIEPEAQGEIHEELHEEVDKEIHEETPHKIYEDVNENTISRETMEVPVRAKKKTSFGKFVAGLVIVSVIGGASIGTSFALVSPYAKDRYANKNVDNIENNIGLDLVPNNDVNKVLPITTNNSIIDIANNVGPSVVSIYNNKVVSTIYGDMDQSGIGSGVIFKEDNEKLYIVTNYHVVEGANSLAVVFLGNNKIEGQLVGHDATTDIAVVSVEKANISAETLSGIGIAPLGDSDTIQVGELAVAIGTPMEAAFNNTVTTGIISARSRQVQISGRTLNLIQTDAAINPGNSGGALVGGAGEVIGINSVKLVDSSVEGMGFAIPINDVKPIIADILENGTIVRPALGIMGRNISTEASELYELPIGILIVQVTNGGTADLGGLQVNDILFEFDGTQITDMDQLKGLISNKRVGDKVEVKVVRNKQKKVVQLTLKEAPVTTTTEPTTYQ